MKIKLKQTQLEKAAQQYLFDVYHNYLDGYDGDDLEALKESFRDVIRYCTKPSDKRLKGLK